MTTQRQTAQPTQVKPVPASGMLQRKCACGNHIVAGGECEACRKKRLQRAAISAPPMGEAPPIVHDVLHSPGQPLNAGTRAFMERRFGHDFSGVRVHTDAKAAESARAVNALAYTVGRDVVFGENQYTPNTNTGQRLMAHELAHVVQQGQSCGLSTRSTIPIDEVGEREADAAVDRVVNGTPAIPISDHASIGLRRKLRVDRPGDRIPNPTGTGLVQTNAEAVEGYLERLAPGSGVAVNRSSGAVSMPTGYCPGTLGGLLQGGRVGYRIGHTIGSVGGHVPLLGPIFGAVGAVIGGLVGGIAGFFGAESPSAAAASGTPTSSTCICDLISSSPILNIEINDREKPAGAKTLLRIPSPNYQKQWGTATVTGQLLATEPWLILAHEMCGHSWLIHRGERDEEGSDKDRAPFVARNDQTGQIELAEPEGGLGGSMRQPRADQYLRHGRTVERENLIRAEHGIEARGYRLRDPYCGESFWRERGMPNGPINWQETGEPGVRTFLEQCEALRAHLPESRTRRYRIDERIPEQPAAAVPHSTP